MKSSVTTKRLNKAHAAQAMAVVVCLVASSGLYLTPAHADNDGRGYGQSNAQQNQNYNQSQNRNNGRPSNYQRYDNHGNRNVYYGYRPDYRPPYYYAKPVYVPPPVYYQPWQSPGINLIFPLDLR